MKKLLAAFIILLVIASCSNPPEKAIRKRWKAVGVVGNERKQEKYKRRFERHTTEFEFTKDGKFIGYQDGQIEGTAEYLMASDKKSIAVIFNGRTEMTLKIVELSGNELKATMHGFMSDRDTVIYKAQ